jgi:hypothetical protein
MNCTIIINRLIQCFIKNLHSSPKTSALFRKLVLFFQKLGTPGPVLPSKERTACFLAWQSPRVAGSLSDLAGTAASPERLLVLQSGVK